MGDRIIPANKQQRLRYLNMSHSAAVTCTFEDTVYLLLVGYARITTMERWHSRFASHPQALRGIACTASMRYSTQRQRCAHSFQKMAVHVSHYRQHITRACSHTPGVYLSKLTTLDSLKHTFTVKLTTLSFIVRASFSARAPRR